MKKNNPIDYAELCSKVCEIARHTGAFIGSRKITRHDIEEKSKNSLVTFVDKQAEKMLVEALRKLIPSAGFIAEEGTAQQQGEEYIWIIDPLDGTTNFIHGVPCFAVSIALMHESEIVLGVVYEINMQECFYAWKGSAAYLNGKIIRVSNTRQAENALLATGFPYYKFDKLSAYINLFTRLLTECRGIRRPGAATVDLAYVACGRFDAFYEYTLNPWDVAAGAFIVQQAGGVVSDFSGGDNWLFGEEIVAGNKAIAQHLLALLKEHFV